MNSNVRTENRTMLASAIAMWMACSLVAFNAYADVELRSETVKFADLNLGTSAGVEALYVRIHAAARRVCDQPTAAMASIGTCVAKAESEAIGKVNVPLLTAYYQKRTGKTPESFIANR